MLDGRETLGDVGDLRLDDDAFFFQTLASNLDNISDIVTTGVYDFLRHQSRMRRHVICRFRKSSLTNDGILDHKRKMSFARVIGDEDRGVQSVSSDDFDSVFA